MKIRTIFTTLAVPATAIGLFAQDNVTVVTRGQKNADEGIMLAQGAVGMMGLPGEPVKFQFFTQEFSFNGRPVTGEPYSADEKTESVQTLADGTHITNSTSTRVYRDGQGRTRREMTLPSFGGDSQPHTMITISDPVNGVSYSLDPQSKTAHQMPGMAMAAEAKMKAEARMKDSTFRSVAVAPDGGNLPVTSEVRMLRGSMAKAPKREDLGDNVIEGVSAKGSRETTTIETGQMGNDRPITITSERWYSADLQIEVKSVHSDPRTGDTTHTMTNINRSEPDPSLFRVPADYKLDEGKPGVQNFHYEYHQ
jgi:hypothetical protein